ncbi:surfeit locus protein 6 homolog [Bacillus rossius redtenbacheri]|uniref:surfeit locus protein 6 homolog n=1 Tax=Bacillus rossius redtenbacheri TaxID=93214 RepID=UPI002FDD7C1E
MKIKLAKNKIKINETALRKLLQEENQFLLNLWQKLPIPYSAREQDGEEDMMYLLPDSGSKTGDMQRKVKIFKPGEGEKHAKRAKSLEELYAKRNTLKGSVKLKFKDRLLKKGLKHKITKQKRKQAYKMKKNLLRPERPAMTASAEPERKAMPVKPVFNSEGKMVFSRFDFTGSEKRSKETQNPQLLLDKMQKQREKLQRLEGVGRTELVAQIKEKEAWKKALRRAQGEKVKDDVELLKKSVRRIKEQKQRSKKKWEDRQTTVDQAKENKQKKRTENLLKRKTEVKQKKMKKASKKGRVFIKS